MAKWWLFCQATESSNKNILKNSKKCFFRPQPLKHKWLLSSEVMSVIDRVLVMDFMKSIIFFVLLQPVHNADFIVPVEIDGTIHQVLSNEME